MAPLHPPPEEDEDFTIPFQVYEWLSQLREEDVELLSFTINLSRALRILGRVIKWLIVTAATTFVGAVALWKAWLEVFPK